MYLTNSRPDIFFAMNTLNQFMSDPRQIHWVTAKDVTSYLHGTVGYGLRYASGCDLTLQRFFDSDWVGCAIYKKSTSGCCFSLGSIVISWCSRKSTSVALSTAKAEYMATSIAS